MTKTLKFLFLFCAISSAVLAKHEFYEGHSLYEISVKDAEQAKFVNELENEIAIDIFSYAHPRRAGYTLVPRDLKPQFESLLTSREISYKIEVQNIRDEMLLEDQRLAAHASRRSKKTARATPPSLDFDEIHRTEVVDAYLDQLGQAYPDIVTVASAGKSFEGRDIKYLKISTTNFEDTSKPIMFISSLLHAREWVTLPATLYAIEKLVINVEERDLLETMDWIIMPIANPDGYEFSHETNRFWRKNRATGFLPGDVCLGVDLNRNFDSPFWGTASSGNPCMDTFHGSGPFSEPETSGIRDIIHEYRNRIAYFADIHSFGSMILYGYGNGQLPQNAFALTISAVQQAQAIDRVKWPAHRDYIIGNSFNVLYAASGVSNDYALYDNIPFAYVYELPAWRGMTGTVLGFLVEPEFIRQAGVETWEGIKTGARYARDNY